MHVDQSQIDLIDESRGLEGVAGTLTSHHAFREPVQLVMHEWYELLERRLIAAGPGQQQLGDVAPGRRVQEGRP